MTVWKTADPSARLTDPEAARPPAEVSFADAQAAANFVVFEPGWLPADCRLAEVTLRPEQPPGRPDDVSAADIGQTPWGEGNPCALRAVVAGDGRRLRIKGFLYDWAPPAASVAPLWETPEPEPVACGDAVGWLGTDYKGNRGACVQRARSQLEVSVLEGTFDDDELADLLCGFEVAAPEAARAVRSVPFHGLNYWVRYGYEPTAVPHGLWDYHVARPYETSVPVAPFALADLPISPLIPGDERFAFDSAVVFPEAAAVECVFRNRRNGSDHLWLVAAREESPLAPSIPPEASAQPAERREPVDLRGTTVHYAALTEERGAWEAVWAEDGVHYVVWAAASPLLDGDGVRDVIDGLSAPDPRS